MTVVNYPGATVVMTRGITHQDGHRVGVDAPDINSLQPFSDADRVTGILPL